MLDAVAAADDPTAGDGAAAAEVPRHGADASGASGGGGAAVEGGDGRDGSRGENGSSGNDGTPSGVVAPPQPEAAAAAAAAAAAPSAAVAAPAASSSVLSSQQQQQSQQQLVVRGAGADADGISRGGAGDTRPHVRAQRLLGACADCLLCRAAAALARVASHPHAPPFCAPVDATLFADYAARVPRPMDLRTIAERLARGIYPFGVSGEAADAAASVRADVRLIWANCRLYNAPRASIVRLLGDLEAEFDAAWDAWVTRRLSDGWQAWLRPSAAALVPLPSGGRLPKLIADVAPVGEGGGLGGLRRSKRQFAPLAPSPLTEEEVAALSPSERHSMLELALPNRAPPPPGWDADDVGGCPWHLREAFMSARAMEARRVSEATMRQVQADAKRSKEEAMQQAEAAASGARIVTAAVGRRVVCRGHAKPFGQYKGGEAHGVYQVDGRVLEDASKRAMSVADFAALAGSTAKRPLRAIFLAGPSSSGAEGEDGASLEQLLQMHGSMDVAARAANAQADPHCTLCGGGESEAGNEILLCDGKDCVGCYHQKCVDPPVLEVPEGAWLCSTCVSSGNEVDPEVIEDERKAEECAGGAESTRVLTNDGVGEQDVPLMLEVVDVIDSSLPLIGRTNAAKLVFAPDHQTLTLVRATETARRVLGAVVLKPHRQRGFLELAFCVVRKEEQRNGVGSRLIGMLKEHALRELGVLHLLTYADDSATGFFERLGFDAEHPAGMPINRFHWGISHYIGSQLRQCVLDPDGVTLYSPSCPKKVPRNGRRLFESAAAEAKAVEEAAAAEAAAVEAAPPVVEAAAAAVAAAAAPAPTAMDA